MKKFAVVLAAASVLAFSGMAFAAEIVMNGSTTVLPIAQSAAEKYMAANPEAKISVSGGGSGNGIKAIIDGTTDIANASRFIKTDEVKAAVEKGVYPVPFAVAMDALLPIVHPENPVSDLSIEQLQGIYTGKIANWKEVGGEDKPIAVVGRDTSSGTYETWNEFILKKERVTPKALIVASSGAMLTTVAQNKNAIGYDGIGYVNKTVKALKVGGKTGSAETAIDGTYPLSRSLYMFTKGWPTGEVMKFLNYLLSDDGQKIVAETGFVPLRILK
ncbi:MAG TPA: phosphate ABC transporter substrate-binding protein [Synergistaceae bacterium]|jgi:phosphate transport system substrate-binding protein|nr:phosphate ABC transporter substrate-binding protein [Synergistaceae bacterium]